MAENAVRTAGRTKAGRVAFSDVWPIAAVGVLLVGFFVIFVVVAISNL